MSRHKRRGPLRGGPTPQSEDTADDTALAPIAQPWIVVWVDYASRHRGIYCETQCDAQETAEMLRAIGIEARVVEAVQ
jgi:hypothetical protein